MIHPSTSALTLEFMGKTDKFQTEDETRDCAKLFRIHWDVMYYVPISFMFRTIMVFQTFHFSECVMIYCKLFVYDDT